MLAFRKIETEKKWNKIKWTKWICPQRRDFFFPFKLHGTHFCCKSTYLGKSNVHFHHDLHSGRADNALSDQQMLRVIDWWFYNWCGTKVSRLPFLKIMCWRFSTEYSAVHLFWMWIKYQMTLNLVLRLTIGFLVTINIRNVCILKEYSIVSDMLFLITAVTIWSFAWIEIAVKDTPWCLTFSSSWLLFEMSVSCWKLCQCMWLWVV